MRSYGDVDAAFRRAAHVVEVEVRVGRHSAVPMECRGLAAEPEPGGDGLVVWGATKVPHWNRDVLAGILGLAPERLVLRASDAGGGFGVRGELYPEDVLVCLLARRFGRAVKWVEDRAEHLVATNHSREQWRSLAGAFDAEGRLLALRDEVFHDNGAYLRTHGVLVPELTLSMLPGPYLVPAYAGVAHVALTNKTPCGTYRGPGRYEATFARERLLDAAAAELGVDPVALRRRNLLDAEDLPVHRPLPVVGHDVEIDVGDFGGLLEHALRTAPHDAWEREAAMARDAGRLVGVGLAVFLEKSGGGGFETVHVAVEEDGSARVAAGSATLGQGIETVLARVVGLELGIEPARRRRQRGRHRPGGVRRRLVGQPLDDLRGRRRAARRAGHRRPGPRDRRRAPGVRARGRVAGRRAGARGGRAGARHRAGRGRGRVRSRLGGAPRPRAGARRHADVRGQPHDLPLRRPRLDGRDRPRHRRRAAPAPPHRLRGRARGRPPAGRGPARRAAPRRASRARCWRSSATTRPGSRRRRRSWTTCCPPPPRSRR